MAAQFVEPNVNFQRISRDEAEQQLSSAQPGSYLVRPSSRPGCLSLSYRNNSGLADQGRLGHLLLMQQANGKWMCEGVTKQYRSVRALLSCLPYNLRLDEQMQGAAPGDAPALGATAGYGAVPSPAQMQNAGAHSGYGKVPNQAAASDDYGRAPPPTGEYAQLSSNVTATPAGEYGRAPAPAAAAGGAAQYNVAPGHVDYGRVPSQNHNGAAPPVDYGRVPAGAGQESPYARLRPTASTKNGVPPGEGPGYGRVPSQQQMDGQAGGAASPSLPRGAGRGGVRGGAVPRGGAGVRGGAGGGSGRNSPLVAKRRTSGPLQAAPPGYVGQRAASPGVGADASPYQAARRSLPVAAVSPQGSPALPARQAAGGQGNGAVNERREQKNYGSVTVAQSVTVNAPHQLACEALKLMQGNPSLAGHERFLRAQLSTLARAKDRAATSTPVYTALVALGEQFHGYHNELRQLVQQRSGPAMGDVIIGNHLFQTHYISIQMQMRELRSLLEHGDNLSSQIHSVLGQEFWQTRVGRNNTISWASFFQVLEETLGGMQLKKVESFVRFMFDCNGEGKVTTQSFNMFIHWFDYEGMTHPTTVADFLLILIARAENVFFFEGFHGFLSREQAESILANKPAKSFIIRLSDSSAGVFILSYIDSKFKTRHRLLNQVDQQGFMVESKTYNTLPDLLAAHASVLAHPVPNDLKFENSAESIYGGGDALYESLAAAAMPVKKAGAVRYHAKIVMNRIWVQVQLELRDTELSIQTNKAPLRRTLSMADVASCKAVAAPDQSPLPCFCLTMKGPSGAAGASYVFGCDDPDEWVAMISAAAAEQQHTLATQSALERSVEEKLLSGIVSRHCDSADMIAELQRAFFSAQRRPGELAPFDRLFLKCLNDTLRKVVARKRGKQTGVPQLQFSKLDLDFQLQGSKCEVEVPVRDTVRVTNTGSGPIDVRVDTIKKPMFSLKFVPTHLTLQPGATEVLHVTLVVHQTVSLQQLVHVSIGPNRGVASIFFALHVSSKMMEALKFEDIDFGPRLGSGAFGQVFHGTYCGREVAIKAVSFEPDYEQELNILRELRHHPAIVEYMGACKRVPFQGFIVLEFMQLGSLDKYIHDKQFSFKLAFSMRVALDVAVGLAHLHKSKIMHLDLKPANVLVASLSPNAAACVKLADFGLSQSRDTDATFRGDFVEGTLLYMAPEMLRERVFSFKGDIFSFAMTLWEMLMRVQPYSGEKHRKLKKPQFEEVRERGELPGDLNEIKQVELRALLAKMFSFEHEQRPSAEQVAKAVQAIRNRLPRDSHTSTPQ